MFFQGKTFSAQLLTFSLSHNGIKLKDEIKEVTYLFQGEGESGIIAWVTFHSYSWMWMYPWGYTEDFGDFSPCVYTDDYDDLVRWFLSE